MSKDSTTSPQEKGPFAYENWKAVMVGAPSRGAFESPLFTDAHITGEVSEGYGPYQLLNAVPIPPDAQVLLPTIILRVEDYLEYDPSALEVDKTDVVRYHGGSLPDEVAALVSLSLGIRLKAGGIIRQFSPNGDPRGHPRGPILYENLVLIRPRGRPPILPRALGTHSLSEITPLASLPKLTPDNAVALVRAARLYQDAMWVAESEPELSWIMFVSAIETAAGHWRAAKESPIERLRASRPDLEKLLEEAGGQELVLKVADQIADYMGATRKFIDFVLEFLPEPPKERPPEFFQCSWERESMERSMRIIYNWRSRALHGGIPFPQPMCMEPMPHGNAFGEKPIGLAGSAGGAVWVAEDTPMLLHTFEYIVRYALLRWWESMLATVEHIA
jgi:hypothetical protein